MLIYKILRPAEWESFEQAGSFAGSHDDTRDGFIHCSSRAQVAATATRIFAQEPQLVVIALDTDRLLSDLRWEPSSSGEAFPHVYCPLTSAAVVAVHRAAGAAQVESVLAAAGLA